MFRPLCRYPLRFYSLQVSSLKSASPISTSIVQPSLTVNYLINSCGLSPESALRASQKIEIKTAIRPDSVLELFRNYEFTDTHIVKLITKSPSLLLADPIKNLSPKIEFFRNNGISDPILAKMLSADPSILRRSLENQIIPSFNYLKSFLHTNENIAFSLGRATWILHSPQKVMGPNIAILRNHGVPESIILKMIMIRPRILSLKTYKFSKSVTKIIEMGFDPSSLMFVHGLAALSGVKKGIWEAKLAVYRSYGWSEDEILWMFRKQPVCMAPSAKKIKTALDFFVNKLNWTPADISKYPTTLFLSLEKRTMPRCSVIEVLLSKGLMKKGQMGNALMKAEDVFLKNYVIKYEEDLPQLSMIYQNVKLHGLESVLYMLYLNSSEVASHHMLDVLH
ncbi:hypothetical protein HHK36_019518 [Tetracentron sinense]|uniref:Mitochondrial transcription termination factor n=1 Tax=Tetracentron sinense TaxID=13715 RepID=A0A835D981_TETSI|nr:hypothetical protein HHK36_019518 [Tetracentron sinense]